MTNEKTEIEKLDLNSMNIAEEKQNELLRIFPEVRTEGKKIDFDKLKLVLGEIVDAGKERYGMIWPGKAECFKTIQRTSMGTLLPAKDESINFDESENLFIEGDNLEVLKLLQKSYLGKIKLIYIDPPYNTGNEFIYPDNFSESLDTYLKYTNQIDREGRKFNTNLETDGRFHSKWLNMMFPRLYLARNFLTEDGAIFISIDDHEVTNLRKICDEIFGEENFIANVVWQRAFSPKNDAKFFSDSHDHILVYSKNVTNFKIGLLDRTEEANARYKNPDNDPRGPRISGDLTVKTYSPEYDYPITTPNGKKVFPTNGRCWFTNAKRMNELVADNRIWFGEDGGNVPRLKRFLSEVQKGMTPTTLWFHQDVGHNQEGRQELKNIFDGKGYFDGPKPVRLLKQILKVANLKNDSIILDFFSGSASLAHAVLEYNQEKDKNLKFICVQLPESCERDSDAFRAGYKNIADIGKDRIRRLIIKNNLIDGFRVFKLADSNFRTWNQEADSKDGLTKQLELHVEHVKQDRTADDILYEILLKSGFPLTTKVETQKFGKQAVYSIAGGMLLVCLEDNLTLELIKHIAEQKPERVVCLDQGFANNDQLKANAVQIFRTKGIASFKTV